MSSLLLSSKFTIRQLRKSPGFSLTAILTLALGIGAVTSVFSVVHAVLLEPFAFRDPGRLVVMREVVEEMRAQYPTLPFNYRHYLRLKQDTNTLQAAAIFKEHGVSISSSGDHPHIVGSLVASPNLLSTLGVAPLMGRDFTSEEATPGHGDVAILTWNGWQSLLNGMPNPVGQTLQIDGMPVTIIGVLPREFRFPAVAVMSSIPSPLAQAGSVEVLSPLVPDKNDLESDSGDFNYSIVARLKPHVKLEQARAELDGLQRAHTLATHQQIHLGISIQSFNKDVTSDYSAALWLLFASVGSVLLIACVNLASLQLARAVAMERESAVRAALGASRTQLLSARLVESLMLALIGGAAGVELAVLGVRLLVALAPVDVPRLNEVQVNLPVLLFAAGLSILTALLFGLLPALRSLRVNPQAALQAGSTRVASSKQSGITRNLLVVAEVACTVTLLVVTGMVLRSFSKVLTQNRGFDASHVTVAEVDLDGPQYSTPQTTAGAAKMAFIHRTLQGLEQLPGVQAVGLTSRLPMTGEAWIDWINRADRPVSDVQRPQVNVRWISPGYLAAMRMPLVAGRDMTETDRNEGTLPALISEKAARAAYPDEGPLGKKISAYGSGSAGKTYTIVGVVADARVNGLKDAVAMVYAAYWSNPPSTISFLVRGEPSSDVLIPEVRRVIWGIDPQVTIPVLRSLDAQVSESIATDRFQTILLSSFGAAALLLALLGVYGVLAYSVTLRRQEFGIRIALGSNKARIMSLVLRQATWLVLSGSVLGLILAFGTMRGVRSLLYETQSVDPSTILGSLLLLCIAAGLAAVLPARRAIRVDPVEVLRAQ
jgi:predicted permease